MRNPALLPPTPPPLQRQQSTEDTQLLEVNLISAQNLKPPSSKFRRLQTYAAVYIDADLKLRTRIDRINEANPTWNDKFIFRVSDEFLSGETSAVSVDIFAVGVIRDAFIGSARFFLSNVLPPAREIGIPAFIAVQIRRPSGMCHGVLNVGAMLIDANSVGASLNGVSAIGYRDMMGEGKGKRRSRRMGRHKRGMSDASSGSGSWGGESFDYLSDGTESVGSNSSGSASSVLWELNGRRELVRPGEDGGEGEGGDVLCGLGFHRKLHLCPPYDIIKAFGALDLNKT